MRAIPSSATPPVAAASAVEAAVGIRAGRLSASRDGDDASALPDCSKTGVSPATRAPGGDKACDERSWALSWAACCPRHDERLVGNPLPTARIEGAVVAVIEPDGGRHARG
jgi:hypothetical protein